MNLGVLAPALSEIWPERKVVIWTTGLLLAGTRILLLAHWPTDVALGLVSGSVIEAALRPITGAPRGIKSDDAGEEDQDRA
jgi:undecaprenyl-diphosphatase